MKLFAALLTLSFATTAFAAYDGELSKDEIKHCRKNGCFTQGVSKNVKVVKVGAEKITIEAETKDRYLGIPVQAVIKTEEGDIDMEYWVLQWIGNKEIDQEKVDNARFFGKKIEEFRKSGKLVNFVVRGSANQMTAEFPIIGLFTNDGDSFFQERVVAPRLTTL